MMVTDLMNHFTVCPTCDGVGRLYLVKEKNCTLIMSKKEALKWKN